MVSGTFGPRNRVDGCWVFYRIDIDDYCLQFWYAEHMWTMSMILSVFYVLNGWVLLGPSQHSVQRWSGPSKLI